MIEKYLSPGNKVEIQFVQRVGLNEEDVSPKKKIYISKINQILEEDKVEILMPIEQSKMVLLPRNVVGSLVVYTANGLYQCDVKAGDRYKSDNIHLQVLELVSGIKKYQRREYYRYTCNVPILSRLLTEEEKENFNVDEEQKGMKGETLDIGGGGARYLMDEEMPVGELVVCCLPLQLKRGVKEVQAVGRILSVKAMKELKKFEIRVQFEKISNAAREQIIQYIFEDERMRRKKSSGL